MAGAVAYRRGLGRLLEYVREESSAASISCDSMIADSISPANGCAPDVFWSHIVWAWATPLRREDAGRMV